MSEDPSTPKEGQISNEALLAALKEKNLELKKITGRH